MKKHTIHTAVTTLLASLVLQLAACGTLMYPERRGQKSGEIDVKVAVLDGIGLLFCIIPGVVAYVVDFSTGAIYLPAGRKNVVQRDGDYFLQQPAIYIAPERLIDQQAIREILTREMQLSDVVDWSKLQSQQISPDQVRIRLAAAQAVGYAP